MLPTIDAPIAQLPDLADSWAWAHVQLPAEGATPPPGLADLVSLQVARLVCPRRLGENRRYRACIVPAFAGGVAAGRGLTGAPTARHRPGVARGGRGTVALPVYHGWEFATGAGGNFEELVLRLEPAQLSAMPGFGVRMVDVHAPWGRGAPLADGVQTLAVHGVLGPLVAPPDAGTADDLVIALHERLARQLAAPAERIAGAVDPGDTTGAVAPPIYGSRHVGADRVDPSPELPIADLGWTVELNLDPANRIAAGLGAAYVRDNQEELMARAWEQVGAVREANRRRALAELSTEVSVSSTPATSPRCRPARRSRCRPRGRRGCPPTRAGRRSRWRSRSASCRTAPRRARSRG